MKSIFRQIQAWLSHKIKAGDEHSLHSPFLFDWYNKVILNTESWPSPLAPEKMRKDFLSNKIKVGGMDLGAGNKLTSRTISDFARLSLGSKNQLSILYRILKHQKPSHILELGTCLGVSTAYFREASSASLTSIEGNEELFNIAKQSLLDSGYDSINFLNGSFKDLLQKELDSISSPWFIYLDGDHTEEGTLYYFEQIVGSATQDSILVIDDIHWSGEMTNAWKKICLDKRVPLSLDFFHFGVLIFRNNQPKQHFVLKSGLI